MWIVTNESFLSVVQDRNNPDQFVIRARIKGDIEKFMGEDTPVNVIEMDKSDYRFRAFVDKSVFRMKMVDAIDSIDYDNFKNTVTERERRAWYLSIWDIMFRAQESLYGKQKWW